MIPQSIRWRLPLSYAAIAAIAALALGAVLLTTLRNYYAQAEMNYLRNNAEAMGTIILRFSDDPTFSGSMDEQFQAFAFFSQTRVQWLDAEKNVIRDSGLPDDNVLTVDRARLAPGIRATDETLAITTKAAEPRAWVYAAQSGPTTDPPLTPAGRFTIEIFRADEADSQVFVEDHINVPSPVDNSSREDQYMLIPARRTLFGFDLNNENGIRSPLRRSNQEIELPLNKDGASTGFIRLSQGPAYGSEIVDSVAQGWLGASVLAIVLAGMIGLYMSQRLTTPLLTLTQATTQMTEGDLTARAVITTRDEVGTLAQSFNEMATRVEETIVTLRRFVADAAHELHTPLTALRTNLELLTGEQFDQPATTFVEQALTQVQRLETLTTDLLELSRLEAITHAPQKAAINLSQLLRKTSELYASQAEQLDISFDLVLPNDDVIAVADCAQIRHALCNLLENALKFTPETGSITVGITQGIAGHIEIWVQDTGIGIPADDLPQLFSRFHRGRNATAYPGSGLGLAIVRAITEAHSGTIAAQPLPSGTRFILRLPAASFQQT